MASQSRGSMYGSQTVRPVSATPSTVLSRPLTQQGLAGQSQQIRGGRHILDKNYYLGELSRKRSELLKVIAQLQEDLEAKQWQETRLAQAEQQNKKAAKKLRQIENELAPLKDLLQQAAAGHSAGSLFQEAYAVREHNKKLAQVLESLQSSIEDHEQRLRTANLSALAAEQIQDEEIAQLSEDEIASYHACQARVEAMLGAEAAAEAQLREARALSDSLQAQLPHDPRVHKVLTLHERILELECMRDSFKMECLAKDPAEQRRKLIEQGKADDLMAKELAAQNELVAASLHGQGATLATGPSVGTRTCAS